MPRMYIDIPEPTFQEAIRRALPERRSVRDQVGYDLERLYTSAATDQREPDRQPAEATQ